MNSVILLRTESYRRARQKDLFFLISHPKICADPEGGQGVRTKPPAKLQKYRVFSNARPDPLKNHKATKPGFNVGPPLACQRNAMKWRFAGGLMMARLT